MKNFSKILPPKIEGDYYWVYFPQDDLRIGVRVKNTGKVVTWGMILSGDDWTTDDDELVELNALFGPKIEKPVIE